MSTKSSLYLNTNEKDVYGHKLTIHIYKDMHESDGVVVLELYCTVCNCSYKLIMDSHLGKQLVQMLKPEN